MAYPRCYLVYAVAPEAMSARDANNALNEYITDSPRGLPVFHDHFTGKPHGGVVVLEVRTDAEEAQLSEPGSLAGWELGVHALTFSLTGVGLVAQAEMTVEEYGRTTIETLREVEQDDKRFWWRRRQEARTP